MKTLLSKIKTSIYFGGLAVGLSLGLNSANAGEILIGIPAAQSGPVGVADHTDFTNGALMAIEEINASGGVNGHTLSTKIIDLNMLTPEGNVAGILNLVESGVHAMPPHSQLYLSQQWMLLRQVAFLIYMEIPHQ